MSGSIRSTPKGTGNCPKCGGLGQLKLRTAYYTRKDGSEGTYQYWQVDHYKIPTDHKSGYDYACYLGTLKRIGEIQL